MSIPKFGQFLEESKQLDEAFNSAPYELTMGKKNAGDVFFTFIDEDEKEFRIQFYTPQGLGKNVRQVFIGQKRGSTYPDAIARFKNPMRVIASMIEATKQFLATPLGKTIDGYAVNFSKKALDRGMTLIPKIIRQSGLKQKLNVMDLTYAPVPDRGYVWLVRKGKDPAVVFDGPKMQGITWDDPDKIGDVPPEQTPSAGGQPSSGVAQHMTSRDLDAHPFRQKVLEMIDAAVTKEGIATPGGSKGYYKFTSGGTFRVYFDKVQQNTFFGSLSTEKGSIEIKSPFNADYAAGDFLAAIRKAAPQKSGGKLAHIWTYTLAGNPGEERFPLMTFGNDRTYTVFGSPKSKSITGTHYGQKYTGTSLDAVLKKIGASMPTNEMIKQFKDDMADPVNKGTAPQKADGGSTVGATSIKQLKDNGFIPRVLGIVDANIDQKSSYLPGESINKVAIGRYKTKGGLMISVNFDSVDGTNLKYEVFSELESQSGVVSGDARRVAEEIMETITYVAEHQYRGEWEINAVPMSAPYPIKRVSHSQGWGYVETANFTLKISDPVLNRVKPGNTLKLDIHKEPLRGKHLLEIIPEKGDKTLMLKDRSGMIYGSVDLDAKGGDVVNSGTLNMPRNAMVFGETVNGMSVMWTGINFPKSGKYDEAKLNTNVTYYYDKGKVAFTPMVIQKGRTLNNPKTFELPLKKELVQNVLDSISDDMNMVVRNMQTLVSTNYNPKQVFLDDIYVDDSGAVLWRGYNMGDRRTTEIMLSTIGKETERLEKEPGTAKKTGVELATYAGSIRDAAPKTRDIDWQINATKNAQALSVVWELTYRRNSAEGAFREYKAQIDRANQYLQQVSQDAKSKGYNVDKIELLSLDDAKNSDEWTANNGENPYSEYEQSMGSRLVFSIK